jgi:hypothetical protein
LRSTLDRRFGDRRTWCTLLLLHARPRRRQPHQDAPLAIGASAAAILVIGLAVTKLFPRDRGRDIAPMSASVLPEATLRDVGRTSSRKPVPVKQPILRLETPSLTDPIASDPARIEIEAAGLVFVGNDAGLPVSNAVVYGSGPLPGENMRDIGRTDGLGLLRVQSIDEHVWIGARKGGYRARWYFVDDPLHDQRGRLEARLQGNESIAIEGQVLDHEGRPVRNAMVRVESDFAFTDVTLDKDGGLSWPIPPEDARTDADGRFELSGFRRSRRDIVVVPEGGGEALRREIMARWRPRGPRRTMRLELVLPPSGTTAAVPSHEPTAVVEPDDGVSLSGMCLPATDRCRPDRRDSEADDPSSGLRSQPPRQRGTAVEASNPRVGSWCMASRNGMARSGRRFWTGSSAL